jgi:DNA-binding NarL/FixJ family response regulator
MVPEYSDTDAEKIQLHPPAEGKGRLACRHGVTMRHPVLVVYEAERRVGAFLEALVKNKRWVLREARTRQSLRRHLERAVSAVVVFRLRAAQTCDFDALEEISWTYPQASCIVVTDSESPALAALCWELGASMVCSVPWISAELEEGILAFMARPAARAVHCDESNVMHEPQA